jgi:chemotaxis receptor (MCP) glutamine deamidase CheD
MVLAALRALPSAGSRMLMRMEMMDITTSNSMSVNASLNRRHVDIAVLLNIQ